jgi:hypothetical protein
MTMQRIGDALLPGDESGRRCRSFIVKQPVSAASPPPSQPWKQLDIRAEVIRISPRDRRL